MERDGLTWREIIAACAAGLVGMLILVDVFADPHLISRGEMVILLALVSYETPAMTDGLKPLPNPVYGCADENCTTECSWHPEELWWFPGRANTEENFAVEDGWYCEMCWDGLELDDTTAPSLAEELKARGLTR